MQNDLDTRQDGDVGDRCSEQFASSLPQWRRISAVTKASSQNKHGAPSIYDGAHERRWPNYQGHCEGRFKSKDTQYSSGKHHGSEGEENCGDSFVAQERGEMHYYLNRGSNYLRR